MILCILIGTAWSHVACSFIKFFFAFCFQILGQDIMEGGGGGGGGGGAILACGELYLPL